MNRLTQLTAAAILLFAVLGSVRAQTYIWTGVGNGWQGGVAPAGTGGEDLVFGDALRDVIHLPAAFNVDTLQFNIDDGFRFVPSGVSTALTLTGGINASGQEGVRADFAGGITTTLLGAQTWDLGEFGTTTFHGRLTGSGSLVVTGRSQTLLLANTTGNASDYTGSITLAPVSTAAVGSISQLVLWGANSLGTGTVTFSNGGNLITHSAPTLANNFIFNNGPLLSGQVAYAPIGFRMWDSPGTTLTGGITLANNTSLSANIGSANKLSAEYPNNTGVRPLPGPITRNPLLISGNIGETGGARSLNIIGPGIIILGGTNTYTGGTNVGFAPNLTTVGVNGNANGSLIFATLGAVPATGAILSGQANNTPNSGYVGIATSAVPNAGDFAAFLAKFNPGSTGAVGLDSLTAGLPSGSPSTFSDNINLSAAGFNTTAFEGIRLGTATSVTLTGTITPQLTANYNFGNGGGKLYVQSNLVNLTTSTYVVANNNGVALMLYLKGNYTYSGGTYANNGFIIFDGANALPASGILRAGGTAVNVGQSYLGFTDAALGGTAVSGAALLGGLFTKFDKPNTWGVVGFDSTNVGAPVTINNLDLTGFNNGVFIGTTTKAVLTGGIGTTTEIAAGNPADTYRFTAADGGTLQVDGALVDGAGARAVVIGVPGGFQKMGDGIVILNGPNTYTGGTTINSFSSITLAGAADTSFGTGAITLSAQGGNIGLAAETAGLNFGNDLVFSQAALGAGFTPQLMLVGNYNFTLSGDISGPPLSNLPTDANPNGTGVGLIGLANPSPINVTLTGDNSGYYGQWQVQNGTLTFASATAAGHGTLQLDSNDATAAFTVSSTLHDIIGKNGGHLRLSNGINLTFDTSKEDGSYEFGGAITDPDNLPTTASVTVTSSTMGENLYLYGHNQYSGGTTITGYGVLGLGESDSAGTGAITINATAGQGGLILNDSVTLTNALMLNQGVLGGAGTFAPTSFNGTPGAPITIGANQGVIPGIPDSFFPAKLTFDANTVFTNGGTYIWGLQNAASAEGAGTLFITGNLDLTSLSLASFDLLLETYDAFGEEGLAAGLTLGNSYQFILIETVGTITGFSADKFVIDASLFQDGLMPDSAFSLTADSQHLYLNFTAVPEPSTYALLALGSGWVLATLRRRRRT